MPIRLQEDFPASTQLLSENIFAINNERATHQDIRPLKILIVNLMPNKQATEVQLLRLISQSPLQIDVDFLRMHTHEAKNTSRSHLAKFYLTFSEVKEEFYDGMIITGAPVEKLPFEEVDYWQELQQVMDWGQTNVTSVVHICWGAQAGLYHYYGIDKIAYPEKLFGVYPQAMRMKHRLCRGFDDVFWGPQSRYTGIDESQIDEALLQVIAGDAKIGSTILVGKQDRNIFLLGHFEYETQTLKGEYDRDAAEGLNTAVPENYFIDDDPTKNIINNWRAHSYLLYHNWLNDVYQVTPYELEKIPEQNRGLKNKIAE